jgi:RimJ/RimL family protein N-acetyltransferase
MQLRPVTLDDVALYERMRCDPAMMAELGGPVPRESIPAKVARDVADVATHGAWIFIAEEDDQAVGHVCIWDHEEDGERITEIGWMVLPEFQGRGLGRQATGAILEKARAERRWEVVHAFPAVTNAPSNGICRSLRFEHVGERTVVGFNDTPLRTNHWRLDLRAPGS